MSEETKRSFWQTLPGIITGITALITAIAGLLIALSQTGVLGNKSSASSQPVQQITQQKSVEQQPDSFSKTGDEAFVDDEKTSMNKKLLLLSFNNPGPFELGGAEFIIVKNKHQKLNSNMFGMLLFVDIKPNHNGSREKVELIEDGAVKPIAGQKNKFQSFVTGKTIEEIYRIQGKIGSVLSIRFTLNNFIKELPLKVLANS